MNTDSRDQDEFVRFIPGRWAREVTLLVTAWITSVVSVAISAVVTIVVLLGGLWLAYVYLPINVFYILIAVLMVDIALGILLRYVFARK